jgi:D-3-phosphoglycerate dehydrogenase
LLITDPALDERALPPSSIGCSLAEGLAKADLISLHANTSTPLLGHREFNLMKTGAFLLNSARGHLVDHEACLLALKQKKLGGLWFDVFEEEPYQGPLCEEEGALLTPHVGTYTSECRQSMERRAVLHLLSCL